MNSNDTKRIAEAIVEELIKAAFADSIRGMAAQGMTDGQIKAAYDRDPAAAFATQAAKAMNAWQQYGGEFVEALHNQ